MLDAMPRQIGTPFYMSPVRVPRTKRAIFFFVSGFFRGFLIVFLVGFLGFSGRFFRGFLIVFLGFPGVFGGFLAMGLGQKEKTWRPQVWVHFSFIFRYPFFDPQPSWG